MHKENPQLGNKNKAERVQVVAKTVGLVVKNDTRALAKADALADWLKAEGCQVVRKTSNPPNCEFHDCSPSVAPENLFCVVVLGGDGTFLSAVRWLGDQQPPLLGVKFGEVGFLAEASEESLFEAMKAIVHAPFTTRARMRLRAEVWCRDQLVASEAVLNDMVINRGALARLAHIKTYVDDRYLTDYRADGLIVSTPTGSTAYSLAAGGPIMHPTVQGFLVTPICPFTLTNRPIILPSEVVIQVELGERIKDVTVTCDGQVACELASSDKIFISAAPNPLGLIKTPTIDYFEILRTKLKWGQY